MQLAIALLTAGLDSPELEAWAAGRSFRSTRVVWQTSWPLHVISVLLLNELHQATGEPPTAILQRLAILAERRDAARRLRHGRRATPSARLQPRAPDRQPSVNTRCLLSVLVDEPA